MLATSSPGNFTYSVTAKSTDGQSTMARISYTVEPPVSLAFGGAIEKTVAGNISAGGLDVKSTMDGTVLLGTSSPLLPQTGPPPTFG